MSATDEHPFDTVGSPQKSGPRTASTAGDLTPLQRSDVMTDDTPPVLSRRFDRLNASDLATVGNQLMRAYDAALEALRASEAEYNAWRDEMVRRKP